MASDSSAECMHHHHHHHSGDVETRPTTTRVVPNKLESWVISLRCFLIGTLSLWLAFTAELSKDWIPEAKQILGTASCPRSPLIIQAIALGAIRCVIKPSQFDVAWRANLLGVLFNVGMTCAVFMPEWRTFGLYLMALAFFHWSEYMMQAIYNPTTTTVDSFMLYHSHAYVAAACAGLLEFMLEYFFISNFKQLGFASGIGLCLVIAGESLRKISMWTAKSNFNHYVQYRKRESHELVTSGVYSLFRHPSYVGWFWWSVGTQLLLCNPFCTVAYALASWIFFNERIYEEESTLISFFGEKYLEYQKTVGTGLPFIHGFKLDSFDKTLKASS